MGVDFYSKINSRNKSFGFDFHWQIIKNWRSIQRTKRLKNRIHQKMPITKTKKSLNLALKFDFEKSDLGTFWRPVWKSNQILKILSTGLYFCSTFSRPLSSSSQYSIVTIMCHNGRVELFTKRLRAFYLICKNFCYSYSLNFHLSGST